MSKVVVHEDFSTHVNDIALLKLGEFISSTSLKFSIVELLSRLLLKADFKSEYFIALAV